MRLPNAIWLLAVLAAFPAHAREIEGVEYPEEIDVGGQMLRLVGVGLRTKWFFNVYTLGAYQKKAVQHPGHLIRSNEPKLLWIRMLRGIGGEKMREAIDEGVEKNTPEEKQAALKERVEQFKAAFPEKLRKGLDIGIAYLPGSGTTIKVGGETKARIAGADFMRALWAIWFGKKPADKDLKKGVLKKS
jgi:hypothetical protein